MTYAADATGPFYHGTRADLAPGDLLAPGFASNYADRTLSWIYFSGTLDAAIWGCELARGEGRERIYRGRADRRVRGRPQPHRQALPRQPDPASYRSREPLRVVGEVAQWVPHPPERLAEMKAALARMDAEGGPVIID